MGFHLLDLEKPLLKILDRKGLVFPTPIQQRAIPIILSGDDLIGLAQTGTGKTIAFILPLLSLINRVERTGKFRPVKALVLSPTRELARQVNEVTKPFASAVNLKSVAIYGGEPIFKQIRSLRKGSDLVIGTPGRVEDHIEKGTLDLSQTQFLVIDEADQMLEVGFLQSVRRICSLVHCKRQTLLFSATMPPALNSITKNYLTEPKEVIISRKSEPSHNIEQFVLLVNARDKLSELQKIFLKETGKRILVFARTKHSADKIVVILNKVGFYANVIHGNKSQASREKALHLFTEGKCLILIATDIAARGIDVPNVELVINFDLPDKPETYLHRIGRTARAGKTGRAISFCLPSQGGNLRAIETFIKLKIKLIPPSNKKNEDKPNFVKRVRKLKSKKRRDSNLEYSNKTVELRKKKKFTRNKKGP